jgi:hypothetical protein
MKGLFLFVTFSLCAAISYAQPDSYSDSTLEPGNSQISNPIFKTPARKYSRSGKFYVETGFNWSWYSKSDILFRGTGYDFTLKDVQADDEPVKGSLQYNFHLGYHISDKYSVFLGLDHMKYVIEVPQEVKINGFINPSVSTPAIPTGQYAGVYNDETITVNPDFLTLEYTDGFNYLKLGVQRQDDIWVSPKGTSVLTLATGLAGGVIAPRADVRLFTVGDNNKLNVAGWAASANAGLKFYCNRWLYLQGSMEAGYSKLYKVYTTGRNNVDKASHHLGFYQYYGLVGVEF